LLTAPQGLGAALILPLSGKLTDRLGGGPLTLFGVLLTAAATVPFALIGAHTSIVWLCAVMVVRGFGIGFAFMPAMAAAFAALERHELSDATPQLNILQRVGGSIGIAVVTVVLQRALNSALTQPPAHRLAAAAGAYGSAFWWAVGLTLAAVVPAIVLMRAERSARREHAHVAAPDEAALAEAMA
ncbi:MAG: MFS transporter, partial [Solirubrobacteraceae bacterium]